MKNPQLKENLTKTLTCVRWNTAMAQASELMEERRIRHLPVIDMDGFVVGILSDRDVKRAMDPQRPAFKEGLIVSDFMSWPAIQVDESTSLEKVTEGMIDEKISAFLVSRGNQVVGIVTSEDLLRLLASMLKDNKRNKSLSLSDVLYQPVAQEFLRELNMVGA